ncbi:hypothetical protein [Streptomyces sp. 3211.6]|uniref:hypothetical protein n=1 Tax=Streptomyces sp. 3211.6 TaxID=1938845 RepID=UPI0016511821|nr:hypothetical protein [Streptomyces sp. 3211.6]
MGEMAGFDAGLKRKLWWRDQCVAAVDCYALENQRIGLSTKAGFKPPAPLSS